jgi:hypothetical protein
MLPMLSGTVKRTCGSLPGLENNTHCNTDTSVLSLAPPAEPRVFPIQILTSLIIQTSKLSINIPLVAFLVVAPDVEHQGDAQNQNRRAGSQVQPIADREVRSVVRHESPCRNQSADVAYLPSV